MGPIHACCPASLLVLAACSPGSVIESFGERALCGGGDLDPAGALLPRPLHVRRLEQGGALARAEVALGERELELGGFERLAVEAGLSAGAGAREGGLVVHTLAAERFAELRARCGVELPDSGEAYSLHMRAAAGGGAEVIIAAANERGAARGAALLLELVEGGAAREAVVFDAPAVSRRGVLEGFYGPTWSWEERMEMVRFAWRMRMNTFVWGPKNEITSRLLWRFDYEPEVLAGLRELASEAERLQVELCATLSPGVGILYGDPGERAIVLGKLRALAGTGASCVALAFDDIPRDLRAEDRDRYPGGLGEAQADLVREVLGQLAAELPHLTLGFVPTDYWTGAIEEHPEYTEALRARLPGGVFVGWTGTEIVSPAVTGSDVVRAEELFGRAPLMGDNYPVVDGTRTAGRIQLGPVLGREASAVRGTTGWIANAMVLPHASKLALATTADLAWNPDAYAPEGSLARAVARIGGDAGPALARMVDHARGFIAPDGDAPSFSAEVDELLERFPEEHAALRERLRSLETLEVDLASLGPLAGELAPWSAKLSRYGRAGQLALDLMGALRGGQAIDPAEVEALAAEAAELRASSVVVAGGAGDRLLDGVITRLR